MNKGRSIAQDIAKGIMIISVIFFHCYMLTFEDHTQVLGKFNIWVAIFPFVMTAFFFYAGYNYTPNDRTLGQNIARRAKQLLIPLVLAFVISTVLISTMELIFHYNYAGATFKAIGNSVLYILMSEPLSLMIGFPKEGGIILELILSLGLLWFLYALFICSIFFYLLVKHTNKSLPLLIGVVIGLLAVAFVLGQFVGVYLPYSCGVYPVITAIMLVAAYLRKFNLLDREIKTKKAFVLTGVNVLIAEGAVIGIGLLCHFAFGGMVTGTLMGGQYDPMLRGFDVFPGFAFAILGTYALHYLCRLIEKVPYFGRGIGWVGAHSAFFYLFHPIFIDLVAIVVFQKKIIWGHAQALFYASVVVILLTLTGLLIDFLLKKQRAKKLENKNV